MNAEMRTFPAWIRRSWTPSGAGHEVKDLLADLGLHTVCQSAQCPNQTECWGQRMATVLILGNRCTRNCRFCAVLPGAPGPPDADEPRRVAEAARRLELRHMVVTSVTRDDLEDGGASHFARTIAAVKGAMPETTVEVLTPDFNAEERAIAVVLESGPEVFGHNIEMPERLFAGVRDARFSYARSLEVLRIARRLRPEGWVKSAFMLGLGETEKEVRATLRDLLEAGADAVAIGQYLSPTRTHAPVAEYVTPERFAEYETLAYEMGFRFAVAGPFVRSSYRAGEIFGERRPEGGCHAD